MLNIKKENLAGSKVKLTINVPSVLMRGFFSRVYNKLSPTVEIKGFRKGMAPRSMVISAIGENKIQTEIINLALQETFSEALKKENLIPVAPPKINIKMLKDLTTDTAELEYEAEIQLLPEIKIGDYKKLKVKSEKEKLETTKDEIEQVLSHLARSKAEFKDIDRPLKEGDRTEINFEGFEHGVKLENLTSKNYPVILGSKVLIPEFEQKIIGLKKGDKKEFKIEVNKKPIDFQVEILQTQEVILPEINDHFAKNFQKKNLQELKKAVSLDIGKQKKMQEERNFENQVLDELLKITKVEVPESLIEQEVLRQIDFIRQRTATMGLTFEKYLENLKKTEQDFRNELKPQAEKTVTIGLALGEIVKKEKINPKDKDAGKIALEKLINYAKN